MMGCQQDEFSTSLTTTKWKYDMYHVALRCVPCIYIYIYMYILGTPSVKTLSISVTMHIVEYETNSADTRGCLPWSSKLT